MLDSRHASSCKLTHVTWWWQLPCPQPRWHGHPSLHPQGHSPLLSHRLWLQLQRKQIKAINAQETENPAGCRAVNPHLPLLHGRKCATVWFGLMSPERVSGTCLQHILPQHPKAGAESAARIQNSWLPAPPCPGRGQKQISDLLHSSFSLPFCNFILFQ